MVSYEPVQFFWDSLAFLLASVASWHLGKLFPLIKMPSITGYLVIGVLVGPFCAKSVTQDTIDELDPIVKPFALAFIGFAAGTEMYFPVSKSERNKKQKNKRIIFYRELFCIENYFFIENFYHSAKVIAPLYLFTRLLSPPHSLSYSLFGSSRHCVLKTNFYFARNFVTSFIKSMYRWYRYSFLCFF